MRFSRFALLGVGILAASAWALAEQTDAPKAASDSLKTVRQKASYGIGLSIGRQVQALDPDLESLIQGLRDSTGGKPQLSTKELQEALTTYQQEVETKRAKQGEELVKKGEDFLAANKKKPDVVTLQSGLQYKVVKEGTGKAPKASDSVTVNYEGRLVDGTVFDSSERNGGPASFRVGGVIPGFSEALQLMKTGSKWQVYIPSNLAYGATPRPGGPIPPNAMLVFDLELVEVKPASPQPGIP
jgi:FKBP-type peptidyl-prolyl cis-trans isomerase